MTKNPDGTQRILAYLDDNMPPEKREEFERELLDDEGLLNDLMTMQQLEHTLEKHAEEIFAGVPEPRRVSGWQVVFSQFGAVLSRPVMIGFSWLTWRRLAAAGASMAVVFVVVQRMLFAPAKLQNLADLAPEVAGIAMGVETAEKTIMLSAYQQADYTEVIRMIDEHLVAATPDSLTAPEQVWLHRLKGLALYFSEDYDAAILAFSQARGFSRENPTVQEQLWWFIAQARLKQRKREDALAALREILNIDNNVYKRGAERLIQDIESAR